MALRQLEDATHFPFTITEFERVDIFIVNIGY